MARTKEQGRKSKGGGSTTKNPPAAAAANSTISTPNNSRRQVVPNIAAAGRIAPRWAETKPNLSNIDVKNETGTSQANNRINGFDMNSRPSNGSGGRGRGRGRPPKNRHSIIASEGVFSRGIAEDLSAQKTRAANQKRTRGEETILAKLETPLQDESFLNDIKKCEKTEDQKINVRKKLKLEGQQCDTPTGYEEIWQSDDELDELELNEISKDNFIADLKKANQMPFVLPLNEETQFNRLIRNNKESTSKHDIELKGEKFTSDSDQIPHSIDSADQTDKFIKAAKLMHIIEKKSSQQTPLMLFQLPASILRIAENSKPHPELLNQRENGQITQIDKNQQQPQNVPNLLENLSHGRESQIGKIQFLRSGKAVLNIDNYKMDISEAIPSHSFETLMRIEAASDAQPKTQTTLNGLGNQTSALLRHSNSSVLMNGIDEQVDITSRLVDGSTLLPLPPSSSLPLHYPRRNVAHLCGPLPYQFICSLDLMRLVKKERRQKKSSSVERETATKEGEGQSQMC